MPRTPENLPRHELIGLEVKISDSTDSNKEGLKGKVVDETKNTFEVLSEKEPRTIPKKGNEFVFTLKGEHIRVEGDLLHGRPEERIGKKLPGKWGYIK